MIKEVFKFIWKSTNQHGVHSPFVYQLVTNCIYKKSDENILSKIIDYRKELLANNNIIKITDLGFGSKTLDNNQRKISEITKKAGASKKYALLLNRIVSYLNVQTALELGTSLGIGTHAIVTNNHLTIDTIEGCPETLKTAKNQFEKHQIKSKVNCYQGDFEHVLSDLLKEQKYDLIYFDGNHQKQATINYFEKCLKNKHNDSVFVFDDIYWSKDMIAAWEYVKNHEEVTVTVDIFKWGIVFFRTEQKKEHFKIRF